MNAAACLYPFAAAEWGQFICKTSGFSVVGGRGFGLPLGLISREWKDRPARSLSYLSYCTVSAVCKLTNEWPVCLAADDSFTEYARRCGLAYLWCRDWLARTEPTSGYFKLLVITWWRYCRIFDAVFFDTTNKTIMFFLMFFCSLILDTKARSAITNYQSKFSGPSFLFSDLYSVVQYRDKEEQELP